MNFKREFLTRLDEDGPRNDIIRNIDSDVMRDNVLRQKDEEDEAKGRKVQYILLSLDSLLAYTRGHLIRNELGDDVRDVNIDPVEVNAEGYVSVRFSYFK